MSRLRTLFTRVVLPHLLVVPFVIAHIHRDANRRDHPTPFRVALRYGVLGIPGALLYRRVDVEESARDA